MELEINGRREAVPRSWEDESLLWVLREHLALTGAKFGCGVGLCGACTVLVDGRAERSCQIAAREAVGRRITTIEGLSRPDGGLHSLQQAWLDEAVSQCGYCQAGQIMSAVALLQGTPRPSSEEIDRALAGNLCRCGTQQRIRRAVLRAAEAVR